MNLADNLKKIRKENNLSQEQLAEKLNVSRQSVSKWESGISYPEMDKVIQICNIFNININELMNENIAEVKESNESQMINNKYISSFFDYITKVVDLFSSMTFKQRLKCIFEQIMNSLILLILFSIIGLLCSEVIESLFQLLPDFIYYRMYSLLEAFYIAIAIIIGVAVLLHIFKIRYLDYYEFVKEDNAEDINSIEDNKDLENINVLDNKKTDDCKIVLEKKKEKVIIRDPKHSEYKFLIGLGKLLLWFVKFISFMILCCFAFTLILFVLCVPVSFLVIKSGLLFIGLIMSLFGIILVNIVVLELIYSFIVSRKWNKSRVFLVTICSLIIFGIGLGISCISVTDFEFENKQYDIVEDKYEVDMNDELVLNYFSYYDDVEFIEKDIEDIEIVVKHSDLYDVSLWRDSNLLCMNVFANNNKLMKYVRLIIDDINHKKIGSYDYQVDIYVYASKNNINIIKKNNYEYDSRIKNFEEQINDLESTITNYDSLNSKLYVRILDLEEIIKNSDISYVTDDNGNIIGIDEEIN